MNRLIILRAYDETLGRFLTQEEVNRYPIEALSIRNGSIKFSQYSGRYDSNRVKIYEGDIVLAYEKKWEIVFTEGCFVALGPGRLRELKRIYCQVEGNIYEKKPLAKH